MSDNKEKGIEVVVTQGGTKPDIADTDCYVDCCGKQKCINPDANHCEHCTRMRGRWYDIGYKQGYDDALLGLDMRADLNDE